MKLPIGKYVQLHFYFNRFFLQGKPTFLFSIFLHYYYDKCKYNSRIPVKNRNSVVIWTNK